MDKNLLYLEIIFICGLIVNLFIDKNLFLKILIIIMLFLFVIKEKDNYIYNLDKYLYVSYGFIAILILLMFVEYFPNIYFIVIIMCAVVLYLYLFKALFNRTYGVIVSCTTKHAKVKITDSFFKSRKIHTIPTKKKYIKDKIVLIELSKFPINKKPIRIIKSAPKQKA